MDKKERDAYNAHLKKCAEMSARELSPETRPMNPRPVEHPMTEKPRLVVVQVTTPSRP